MAKSKTQQSKPETRSYWVWIQHGYSEYVRAASREEAVRKFSDNKPAAATFGTHIYCTEGDNASSFRIGVVAA